MQQAFVYETYRVHDFTTGSGDVIDAREGDYTLHDYGRGFIEVGRVMPSGHVFGVMAQDVPFDVEAAYCAMQQADYDATIADFEAMTGRV